MLAVDCLASALASSQVRGSLKGVFERALSKTRRSEHESDSDDGVRGLFVLVKRTVHHWRESWPPGPASEREWIEKPPSAKAVRQLLPGWRDRQTSGAQRPAATRPAQPASPTGAALETSELASEVPAQGAAPTNAVPETSPEAHESSPPLCRDLDEATAQMLCRAGECLFDRQRARLGAAVMARLGAGEKLDARDVAAEIWSLDLTDDGRKAVREHMLPELIATGLDEAAARAAALAIMPRRAKVKVINRDGQAEGP